MNDDEMPPSPISEMGAAAVGVHQVFLDWQAAGFTEDQAFQLVRDQLMITWQQRNNDDC